MSQITLTIPDETLVAMHTDASSFGRELRLVAAVKLCEIGRLSSGAAAKLAGLPRAVFLMKLAEYGVDTFTQSEDELRLELENA